MNIEKARQQADILRVAERDCNGTWIRISPDQVSFSAQVIDELCDALEGSAVDAKEFFSDKKTSVENIAEAGWVIRHGMYSWNFHSEKDERHDPPFWVRQLMTQAELDGAEKARAGIRRAIAGEVPLFGSCGPHLPKAKD